MVKRGKILLGAILAMGLVAGLYLANRYWIAPAVKTRAKSQGAHPLAPDFSFTDLSGRKLKLSDYKGKVVLLDFWATWCGPCRIEIPWFVELQARYRDQGFAVIGISMDDDPESVRDFYREKKMNYPVAMGDNKLAELYGGIFGLPISFLIGRDGRIYAKHEGATTDPSIFEEEIQALLKAPVAQEVTGFKQVGRVTSADEIELGDPEEINSEVPGVNLSKLTAAEKEQFKKLLESRQCNCGWNLNLLKCWLDDRSCGVSRRLAREELERFLKSHV